jgi:acyl carrier protein
MPDDNGRILVLRDRAEYQRQVTELARSGDIGAPIPVVAGAALDRSLAVAAGTLDGPRRYPGLVITVNGDDFAPLGVALAHYTQRAMVEVDSVAGAWDVALSERCPVTVVLEPDKVIPELLGAMPATRPVAIFTARDFPTASRLVLRTLAHRPEPELAVLEIDAGDPAGNVAAAREAVTGAPDVVTFSAHGRECGLILRHGVLCGRAHGTLAAPPGQTPDAPLTACEQGHGCYVNGWRGERLVAVDSLNATVVLIDSCRALRVAGGAFGSRVSLALAALDGRAIGFVGSTWLRTGQDGARERVLERLRRGDALAVAVAAANSAMDAAPESLGPFTVIGDAAVQLAAEHIDTDATTQPATRPATQLTAQPAARSTRRAHTDFMASCSLFPASEGLRAAAARPHASGAAQLQLVNELLEYYLAEVYNFCRDWPRPVTRIGRSPARCHTCGSPAAFIDTFSTPVIPSRVLATERCPKCTGVQEGFADTGFTWNWTGGRVTATRGERFSVGLRLRNSTGHQLRGAVGAAIPDGAYFSARMDPAAYLAVPPHAETSIDVSGVFDEDGPVSDFHYLKIAICSNGRLSLLTRPIYMSTPYVPSEGGETPWTAGQGADPALIEAARSVLQEVLGRDGVAPGAAELDFFSAGGDSLGAVALLKRVRERFGVVLRLRDFLVEPTDTGLAVLIAESLEAPRR